MGLTHTPRVIASIGRGLWRHRQNGPIAIGNGSGLQIDDPTIYNGRAGFLDVDYLGHLNNAAYLAHAELARWEWTAQQGILTTLLKDNCHFIAASSAIRYRREIRPVLRTFQVETAVVGMSDDSFYIQQNFRYPPQTKKTRIRAQYILRGVLVQNRKVIDPRKYFQDRLGFQNLNAIQIEDGRLVLPGDQQDEMEKSTQEMLGHFIALENGFRDQTSLDDRNHREG